MKICPFCESELSDTARKCKYCWEWVTNNLENWVKSSNLHEEVEEYLQSLNKKNFKTWSLKNHIKEKNWNDNLKNISQGKRFLLYLNHTIRDISVYLVSAAIIRAILSKPLWLNTFDHKWLLMDELICILIIIFETASYIKDVIKIILIKKNIKQIYNDKTN